MAEGPAGAEFFEKQVRPLLVERCQKCHNPTKTSGGLKLTDREAILKGGDSGPAVVPGRPAESLLVRAVGYLDNDIKMPPNEKLADSDAAKLRQWVALGVPWPASNASASTPPATPKVGAFRPSDKQRRWWAFQAVQDRVPPAVKDTSWPRNEIDRFVLAELEARSLQPAKPADRRTWIRRATIDLTGLSPSPEEVQAFLADGSPAAQAKVVDRLLASPAYGQRWARHWLDVARYADFFDADPKSRTIVSEITEAWRYRDWVVDAFNADLPFDRFIVHQIAGDLLPAPDGKDFYAAGMVATTFLTNGVWDRGDADKEKIVSDMVDDNIDAVGKAFMGLTLGCARCHDHKFDPISQEDYYALAGIFYSSHMIKELGDKGDEYVVNRVPLAPKAYVARRDDQLKQIGEVVATLAALDKQKPPPPADDPQRKAIVGRRDHLLRRLPSEPPLAIAIQEGGTPGGLFPGIQDVPIHIRGSYARLGAVVPRRMPQFFAGASQTPISGGSGRRELAGWVASKNNPLTARVIVNRLWQWHFGSGLVPTPNNFGLQSEPPSHPALLDWLASRFVKDGWSLKTLHRRMMLSATYGQTSAVPREQAARDPENRWLGRFAPRRLEAEAIRDALLFAAGQLDLSPGGPAGDDVMISRRSLYVQTARWDRSSFATLFDAANPDASSEKRSVSTVAPQSLFLLNNDFTLAQAKHFAERVLREAPADETARIQFAFEQLFARPASAEEISVARQVLSRPGPGGAEAAWKDLAHVLFCSNEFVYLN